MVGMVGPLSRVHDRLRTMVREAWRGAPSISNAVHVTPRGSFSCCKVLQPQVRWIIQVSKFASPDLTQAFARLAFTINNGWEIPYQVSFAAPYSTISSNEIKALVNQTSHSFLWSHVCYCVGPIIYNLAWYRESEDFFFFLAIVNTFPKFAN